jgi:hypothetical protein
MHASGIIASQFSACVARRKLNANHFPESAQLVAAGLASRSIGFASGLLPFTNTTLVLG